MGPNHSDRYERFHHLDMPREEQPPEPEIVAGSGPMVKCPRCYGVGGVPTKPPENAPKRQMDTGPLGYTRKCPICAGNGKVPLSRWVGRWWGWLRGLFGR